MIQKISVLTGLFIFIFGAQAFAEDIDSSLFEVRLSKIENINPNDEEKITYPLNIEWGVYFTTSENHASGNGELKKVRECAVTNNEKENLKNCKVIRIVLETKKATTTSDMMKAYIQYEGKDWRPGTKFSIYADPEDFDFVRLDRPIKGKLSDMEWVELSKKKRELVKNCALKLKDQPIGKVCSISFDGQKLRHTFQIQKIQKSADLAYNK